MARYLVTGGCGFIGSQIAAELVRKGEDVRILDDNSTGSINNIATFQNHIKLILETYVTTKM